MKRNYEEWYEELNVGDYLYTLMSYVGVVKMKIISKNDKDKEMEVKSVGQFSGYQHLINEEIYNKVYDYEGNGYFRTEDEVKEFYQYREYKKKYKFIKQFSEDKDLFIEEVVRIAYNSQCDPEHGDYSIAKGIEEVAKGYGIKLK